MSVENNISKILDNYYARLQDSTDTELFFPDFDLGIIDQIEDNDRLNNEKEHQFLKEAFEEFESIRKEKGIFSAGLYIHEKYKELYANKAKNLLINLNKIE